MPALADQLVTFRYKVDTKNLDKIIETSESEEEAIAALDDLMNLDIKELSPNVYEVSIGWNQ